MTLFARLLFGLSALAPFAPFDFQTAQGNIDAAKPPAVDYLFFDADWCGPCDKMRPIVERLNERGYKVQIVNVDRQRDLVDRYGVTGIPAFVAVVNGKVINRRVGVQNKETLERFVYQMSRSVQDSDPAHDTDEAKPESDIPGAVKVESLLRVTYDVPKAKAKALVAFLKAHSTADFTAEIEDDSLRITATPDVQKALGPFVQTVLKH